MKILGKFLYLPIHFSLINLETINSATDKGVVSFNVANCWIDFINFSEVLGRPFSGVGNNSPSSSYFSVFSVNLFLKQKNQKNWEKLRKIREFSEDIYNWKNIKKIFEYLQ